MNDEKSGFAGLGVSQHFQQETMYDILSRSFEPSSEDTFINLNKYKTLISFSI